MTETNPYVIAEIASSHEGDPARLLATATAAADAGASAVKIQIFDRDALVHPSSPAFDDLGEVEIPKDRWPALLASVRALPCDVIVEPYDLPSLGLARSCGVERFKTPACEIDDRHFLASVAGEAEMLFVGVGSAPMDVVAEAVEAVASSAASVHLVAGYQNFPTRLEDAELGLISLLGRRFGLPVCYADHTDADSELLPVVIPAMALAAGAFAVEKHITLDRSERGRDYHSSLNPHEFSNMVTLLRTVRPAVGVPPELASGARTSYSNSMGRFAVAARPLEAGRRLVGEDLQFQRTGGAGIPRQEADQVVGAVLTRALAAGTIVKPTDLAPDAGVGAAS